MAKLKRGEKKQERGQKPKEKLTTLKGPKKRPISSQLVGPLKSVKEKDFNKRLFPSKLVKTGSAPEVGTIIYIHGIGNKPVCSVLKCQWDTALFGKTMGDRTRMAYWVDRERYPTPEEATCGSRDIPTYESSALGLRSLEGFAVGEIKAISPSEQKTMRALRDRLIQKADKTPSGIGTKVLPLPEGARRFMTRLLTKVFLHDVRDYLFDENKRAVMEGALRERLEAGGGPFIVIGHSQGSMISYNVLRQLSKADCDVRLYVTIGSPLGIQEVQDVMKKWNSGTAKLPVPECVDHWLNVADRLDVVALDGDISNDFRPNSRNAKIENLCEAGINLDWRQNPHSGTGYLGIEKVHTAVREAAGSAFVQLIGRNVIGRDLVDQLEDSDRYVRHATLIQLATDGKSDDKEPISVDEIGDRLIEHIEALVGDSQAKPERVRIQRMKRFVSADLTRSEIERLRSSFHELKIDQVWRNALKRALIYQSTNTIQARPGILGYGARGQNISWAVLDTGIRADHPHFKKYKNVVEQWDCTGNGQPERHRPHQKRGFFDGNGHGTHVAGIIAGSAEVKLHAGQPEVLMEGMAPETRLYDFKVLKDDGNGEDAFIIKALDKIADKNDKAGQLVIHGVNLSLGGSFDPSVYGCGHTPLCQELRRLWNQGVLVCLAAGNEGYALIDAEGGVIPANMDLSIGDPANLQEAIAVGSIHKTCPHTYGVSYFSSRGPTADGRMKPDVVAPGEKILSARHDAPIYGETATDLYIEMSGTSMATPHVSGLLAAFLSARREFIAYPDRVKKLLLEHCTDLERDPYIQGRGMPNLVKMLVNT